MTQQTHTPVHEDIVLPQLAVIDSHMHLWDRIGFDYFAPEFLADVADGHNVHYQRRLHTNLVHDLKQLIGPRAPGVADGLASLIDGVYIRQALRDGVPDGQAAAAMALNYLALELEKTA